MTEIVKELQKTIDLENISRARCYRRFSRIKFVELTEEQRKTFMKNCINYEVERLKTIEKDKEAVKRRKSPEELFRDPRLTDEALKDPWE